jgi:hypothetical protein
VQTDLRRQLANLRWLVCVVEQPEQVASGRIGQRPIGQLPPLPEEMGLHVSTDTTVKTGAGSF